MPVLTYKSNLSPSATHDFENADRYGKVKLGTIISSGKSLFPGSTSQSLISSTSIGE